VGLAVLVELGKMANQEMLVNLDPVERGEVLVLADKEGVVAQVHLGIHFLVELFPVVVIRFVVV
jgi:hypothetical protein